MWSLSYFAFFVLIAHCTSSVFSEESNSSHAKGSHKPSKPEKTVGRPRQWNPNGFFIPIRINGTSAEIRKAFYDSFEYYDVNTCVFFEEVESFFNLDSRFGNSPGIVVSLTHYDIPQPVLSIIEEQGRNMNEIHLRRSLSYDDAKTRINQQLFYALGFSPEHRRRDRDEYVTILTDNIDPDWKSLFETRKDSSMNFPYDYDSVGNFHPTDCGKDGKETTRSKTPKPVKKNLYLSDQDIFKINYKYCQP